MFRRNVIANFFGQVWPSLLAFLFVPIYIQYLGVEAYGLIGIFTSFVAIIAILDLGLSTTAKREMALKRSQPSFAGEARNIVRTMEIVYGLVALLIALSFVLAADQLAADWITAEGLSRQTIESAVIIFGITLALRWPVALYSGVLMGLERQVLYNVLVILVSSLRSVGAVLAIVFWSPTILMFLFWQLGTGLIELLVMYSATWHELPQAQNKIQARFDINLLKKFSKFSALLSINSISVAVLKQTDKVMLSGLVPLQHVGYYSIAYSAYSGMSMLGIPVSEASFPRFSSLIAENKIEELADIYHKACQYLSFISVPVASVVFYFSHDILLFWTRSAEVADNAAVSLSLFSLTYVFHTMRQIPWRLQLSYGVTRLMVTYNLVAMMTLFPVMYVLIEKFGINGAGIGLFLAQAGYYCIMPHWMHALILPAHKWRWYVYDTLLFIVLGWLIFGMVYLVNVVWRNLLFSSVALVLSFGLYILVCNKIYPAIHFFLVDGFQKILRIFSKGS
ncbi:MAG: oligosaccharide flippase family protein [Anaerolineae bacterium]|nr:oligosaccharide flippase family protein [Anaerolineae bacterium]